MQIAVYHKGDKKRNIEGTGEERMMGEEQFARVKKHGWAVQPKTSKDEAKSETATDSGTTTKTTTDANDGAIAEILKGNVTSVVAKIKKLAEAKDMETIKAIGAMELTAKEPRSTIAGAVAKFESES